ncbi:hypothetical protein BJ170DRAFT_685771 [Xylariales sp. AK1849]|nr:hypothetical protein BJ170DRAFT_685771 [Xylariales sp. AK1849]
MASLLYQGYMKWFPIDLPAPNTFAGQTGVVTGGTGGLGLGAAVHLINLGAAEVIISSRNPARSQAALESIEKATGGKSKDKVTVLELDQQNYASVVKFAEEIKSIKQGKGGVDVVILNAGVVAVDSEMTEDGWDQNVQVNTLSTLLLAMLLLSHMKAERASRESVAHLSIVGSMQHTGPSISEWATWTQKGEGVLEHLHKPENFPGPNAMYATTKLLTQYGFLELAKRALGPDGRPQVIMNTMCPGVVKTDLSRNYKKKHAAFVVVSVIFFGLFGKSIENGARTYMAAVTTNESEHVSTHLLFFPAYPAFHPGLPLYFCGFDFQLQSTNVFGQPSGLSEKPITSEAGRKMQAQVWGEITRELMVKIPETKEIVGA